ncbi:MAG: hypothetical protein AAF518_28060 [Spirochaetota bacterium]
MARDKEWIDCPVCGAKDSMVWKTNVTETFKSKALGIEPYQVTGLEGHFCSECGDGFFTRKSENKIRAEMVRQKSFYLAKVTLFKDLLTPDHLAKELGVTRQRINTMMNEGLLKYATQESNLRLPLKSELTRLLQEQEDKREKVIPVNWNDYKKNMMAN